MKQPLHHKREAEVLAFGWHCLGMVCSAVIVCGALIGYIAFSILTAVLDVAAAPFVGKVLLGVCVCDTVIGMGGILWHCFGAIEHWTRF